MGMTLRNIPCWTVDFPVKEVISASKEEYFNVKNLKEFASNRCNLRVDDADENHYFLTLENGDFIEFIQ